MASELVELYETYTTHVTPTSNKAKQRSLLGHILNTVRSAVLADLGYYTSLSKPAALCLRTLARLHPGWYDSQCNQVLYVPFVPNGRLLDVGCGNGATMVTLQERGWRVRGIDFDPKAVAAAQTNGLDVSLGGLLEHRFPSKSFDTILVSHVIEHVPDPIAVLTECHRLLKPGGTLVALTPNADSRSHKMFGECWRGLEVPRHLHIFTPQSLATAARQAGFENVTGATCIQGVFYLPAASRACQETGSFTLPPTTKLSLLANQFRLYFAGIRLACAPGGEETVLLRCRKEY